MTPDHKWLEVKSKVVMLVRKAIPHAGERLPPQTRLKLECTTAGDQSRAVIPTAWNTHLHDGLSVVVTPRVKRVPLEIFHVDGAPSLPPDESLQLLGVEHPDPFHWDQVPVQVREKKPCVSQLRKNQDPSGKDSNCQSV